MIPRRRQSISFNTNLGQILEQVEKQIEKTPDLAYLLMGSVQEEPNGECAGDPGILDLHFSEEDRTLTADYDRPKSLETATDSEHPSVLRHFIADMERVEKIMNDCGLYRIMPLNEDENGDDPRPSVTENEKVFERRVYGLKIERFKVYRGPE